MNCMGTRPGSGQRFSAGSKDKASKIDQPVDDDSCQQSGKQDTASFCRQRICPPRPDSNGIYPIGNLQQDEEEKRRA